MRRKLPLFLFALSVVAALASTSFAQEKANVEHTSWGRVKTLFREDQSERQFADQLVVQAMGELQNAETDAEVEEILDRYPPIVRTRIMAASQGESIESPSDEAPWNDPAAQVAMEKFDVSPSEILAVQKIVTVGGDEPVDSSWAVITDDQWYFVDLDERSATKSMPSSLNKTRIWDIYGSRVDLVYDSRWCTKDEWVVTFYLPVCFHEAYGGYDDTRFDGILDAWAQSPPCWVTNGGPCTYFTCGKAWKGAGYTEWWDFETCGDDNTKRAGKLVQKRWLYSWRNAGVSDNTIARLVKARIRF